MVRDEYGRRLLVPQVVVGAAAVAITVFVLAQRGLRWGPGLAVVPTLLVLLIVGGVACSVALRRRIAVLRQLRAVGISVPATFGTVEWSSDPESAYGESIWTYEFGGRRFEIRALEHGLVAVRKEATVLLDPASPERAVLVMPDGFTRGGGHLTDRSPAELGLVALLFVAWGGLILGVAFALIS